MLSASKLTLITRNLEPHMEWHNAALSNLDGFIQYDLIHPYFFQNKLNYSLRLSDSAAFITTLMDEYGMGQTSPSFQFLGSPSFIVFFKQNMIDVPQCFQKSTSLLNKQNNLLMLKFLNFIMRHGLKLKVTQHFLRAVNRMLTPSPHAGTDLYHKNWKSVFLSLSFLTRQGNYQTLVPLENEVLRFTNRLTATTKSISTSSNAFAELFKHFAKVEPIFSFYIYKVDKKIFKNTRGKSGKYTFIWKYIPPYKRKFFVFTWLIKELRLKNGLTLAERLKTLFELFSTTPTKTWIYRVKKFAYNYVYKNCRFTLADTYRTTTK
jgi:hypothetical protein